MVRSAYYSLDLVYIEFGFSFSRIWLYIAPFHLSTNHFTVIVDMVAYMQPFHSGRPTYTYVRLLELETLSTGGSGKANEGSLLPDTIPEIIASYCPIISIFVFDIFLNLPIKK